MAERDRRDWDEIYRGPREELPWDTGAPSEELVRTVERGEVGVGRALDVGCGTGTEAVYLAGKGFTVSAIDVSKVAIGIAEEKARKAGAEVAFAVASALHIPFKAGCFSVVNDRGCFHVFSPEHRRAFSEEVHRVIEEGGLYLMRCFSEKAEPIDEGPYRLSRAEIQETFSDRFEISRIREIVLRGRQGSYGGHTLKGSYPGYECLMRKRGNPVARPGQR
jgi:SAM-dependent methyltransferase